MYLPTTVNVYWCMVRQGLLAVRKLTGVVWCKSDCKLFLSDGDLKYECTLGPALQHVFSYVASTCYVAACVCLGSQ